MIRSLISRLIFGIPHQVLRACAWLLTFFWFDIFRIRRTVAVQNILRAFPEFGHDQAVNRARQSCFHLALNLLEYVYFPFFDEQHMPQLFVFEGLEHVQAARTQKKGILLLGLHLGNGDLAIAGFSRLGHGVNLISKEFKAGWLNQLWFQLRARHSTKFIPVEKSSFDILRALRNNESVIFVLDQFMGPPSGVPTTFFGHPTGTAAGLALFADRSRAPVIPCYGYRDERGVCHVVFHEPILFEEKADREATVKHMTQVYTNVIEGIVRRFPEQWMWIHRRWKNFA